MDRVKLGDVCLKITDGEHGSVRDDNESCFFYLNNNNISDYGIVIRENSRRISRDTFNAIRKRTCLSVGDVVIATCGTLGKTQVIREDPNNYEFSRSVGILRPDPKFIMGEYLHYFFSLQSIQKKIKQVAAGGVQKHFYIEDMEAFEVLLPPLTQQENAVQLLQGFDSKIGNNRRLISELEDTARLIYDYWFTQFDFPNENGDPYRSSGGRMVWSEELKHDVPSIWRIGTFDNVIKNIRTGLNPRNHFELVSSGWAYLTVKNLTHSGWIDFSVCDYIDDAARGKAHSRSDVLKGDILFASIAPLGRCHLVQEDPKDWEINESVFSVRPNVDEVSSEYLYLLLKSPWFIKAAEGSSAGSVFRGIRNEELRRLPTIIPSTEVMDSFTQVVSPLLKEADRMAVENRILTSLRDWLLPMLMNGQARVE